MAKPNKQLKKALIDADLTITELANITGFTREHLSGVINGRIKSLRVKKVIALALQKNPNELWETTTVER